MVANHLPAVATPTALSAIRLSLIPTLHFLSLSSPSTLRRFSSFAPSQPLLPSFLPIPHSTTHLSFFGLNRVPAMVGHLHPKCTASFSGGSSSGGNKEILVQHLLVKEDDLKLLVELMKRIAQEIFRPVLFYNKPTMMCLFAVEVFIDFSSLIDWDIRLGLVSSLIDCLILC
ncbi:hypothetical protein RHGRI_002065 [Rhododendron griersonianum]|uniref:Uncharacterized protein n=1 Tax=Rhododendron griersonianum TaxID=479676 RepID=A0AAV6LQP5_9ERIC|nr:hypothetical protein RHGRI_002065 [Rhododendron griersonianum]